VTTPSVSKLSPVDGGTRFVFERYSAAYEPLLRAQEGPPADVHA
jgi:hypothetical protein